MPHKSPVPMPSGLPSHLCGDEDGFNALCELIGVSGRKDKQALAGSDLAKAALKEALPDASRRKALQASERMQRAITALYGDPERRRLFWKNSNGSSPDAQSTSRPSGGFRTSPIPSLERASLLAYDPKLLDANAPSSAELECLAQLYDPDAPKDESHKVALAALIRLKSDIEDWKNLPDGRRTQAVAAAFAAATLIDDARFLLWASNRDGQARDALAFLHPDGGGRADGAGNAEGRLKESALALSESARGLADGQPTEQLFDELADKYNAVASLRRESLANASGAKVDELIDELDARLSPEAERGGWERDCAGLIDRWRDAYAPPEGAGVERLQADRVRVDSEMDALLSAIDKAKAGYDAAGSDLAQHKADVGDKPTPSRDERRRESELFHAQSAASDALDQAIEHALDVLAPNPTSAITSSAETREVVQAKAAKAPKAPVLEGSSDETGPMGESSPAGEEPAQQEADPEPQSDQAPQPKVTDDTVEAALDGWDEEHGAEAIHEGGEPESSDDDDDVSAHSIREAIWRAIGAGKLGLAYHIAKLGRDLGTGPDHPSPEFLASVALGAALSDSEDAIAAAFGRYIGYLKGTGFADAEQPNQDALSLLLLSALLRPAIFAHYRLDIVPILRSLPMSSQLRPAYSLAKEVSVHAEKFEARALSAQALDSLLDEALWRDRLEKHWQDAEEWRRGAKAASFMYPGSTAVWQKWLAKTGELGKLASHLKGDDAKNVREVERIAELLSDKKGVQALIEQTDRHSQGPRGEKIDGSALRQMERHLKEPVRLAKEWLRIMSAKPSEGGVLKGQALNLQGAVKSLAPSALEATEGLMASGAPPPLDAALACAAASIKSLAATFGDGDLDVPFPSSDLSPTQVLSDGLILVDGIEFEEDGQVADDLLGPHDTLALLVRGRGHRGTLAEAFDARLEAGDLQGANLACGRMAAGGDPAADDAEARLDDEAHDIQDSWRRELSRLDDQIKLAFASGHLNEQDREDAANRTVGAFERLDRPGGKRDFSVGLAIKRLKGRVGPAIDDAIKKIAEDIEAALAPLSRDARQRLDFAVGERDLAALNDMLDRAGAGQPLVVEKSGRLAMAPAFVDALRSIELASDAGDKPSPRLILDAMEAIETRESMFRIPYGALTANEAASARELLESWRLLQLKVGTPDAAKAVEDVFRRLGFPGASVEPKAKPDSFSLRIDPLRDRSLCPIHTFGSDAEGSYEIELSQEPQARGRIVQVASNARPGDKTLILHLGLVSLSDREWVRHWSIEQRTTGFIVIDDAMAIYLASVSQDRLRAMFECALPFTSEVPFFTKPGLVPPEAFFGRAQEIKRLTDQDDGCFVYGGRQLGKTALLHRAQAEFHAPDAGQIGAYIDLNYSGVGTERDADHVWKVLWDEFSRLGVVPDQRPQGPDQRKSRKYVDPKEVTGPVEAWLGAQKGRRILLLLDEADAFLESDSKANFKASTQLKGLMDSTRRGFKVVLCGLHNVLRSTEFANHPLAHLGEPICVGPLLSNGDIKHAEALVREPLESVGFHFKKDELLVTRILAWTNYYPSLIQLFCEALLRHLRKEPRRLTPGTISKEDVEDVIAQEDLRDSIREKFSLTLQLDPRYKVITYSMAWELYENQRKMDEGLLISKVLAAARENWAEGFNISMHEFEILLQEMRGLGILRRRTTETGENRYVFRSRNILGLLGDLEVIIGVLDEPRKLQGGFQPSEFRPRYRKAGKQGVEPPERAPLTSAQESELKLRGGVAVVCGTDLSDFGKVHDFLDRRLRDVGALKPLGESLTPHEIVGRIKKARPRADVNVWMVGRSAPWTLSWIDRIRDSLKKVVRGRKIRIVLQAGTKGLWQFLEELDESAHEYIEGDVEKPFDWFPVRPWDEAFLRRWVEDQGLHEVSSGKVADLFGLTGGWPSLLYWYANSSEIGWQAKSKALENHIERQRHVLAKGLGLGPAEAWTQMKAIHDYGALSRDEAESCAKIWEDDHGRPISPNALRLRLAWGRKLGLIQDVGGKSEFNPLVKRLLSRAEG